MTSNNPEYWVGKTIIEIRTSDEFDDAWENRTHDDLPIGYQLGQQVLVCDFILDPRLIPTSNHIKQTAPCFRIRLKGVQYKPDQFHIYTAETFDPRDWKIFQEPELPLPRLVYLMRNLVLE